jgi:hypothetical protein
MMMTQDRRDRIDAYRKTFGDLRSLRTDYNNSRDWGPAVIAEDAIVSALRAMTLEGISIQDLLDTEPKWMVQ